MPSKKKPTGYGLIIIEYGANYSVRPNKGTNR